jgi:hypothetical protein
VLLFTITPVVPLKLAALMVRTLPASVIPGDKKVVTFAAAKFVLSGKVMPLLPPATIVIIYPYG